MAAPPLLNFLLSLSSFIPVSLAYSSSPAIGINYGQVANNLPAPAAVIPLLRAVGVRRVKLYDTNPSILRSFTGTDIEFVVGLPDQLVPKIARDPAAALSWIKSNLQPHLPGTKIFAVTVGNEILSGNSSLLIQTLLPAMQRIHSALASLSLERQICVTTAHSLTVLSTSYPPSAGSFRRELLPYLSPLIKFLNKTGSPFLINAYPFFAYKADPKRVSLDYVLFESNASASVVDFRSGLRYGNMLHAQVDAVVAAVAAAGGGKMVEVRVSETGWPSAGDEDEVGATAENARRYNLNLMKMVAQGKATPMQPGTPLQVYVFALFNENMKPGPASERHYGLFKPDGNPAYDIGVAVSAINSTASGNADVGDGFAGEGYPPQLTGDSSTGSYYSVSSAAEEMWWLRVRAGIMLGIAAALILQLVV